MGSPKLDSEFLFSQRGEQKKLRVAKNFRHRNTVAVCSPAEKAKKKKQPYSINPFRCALDSNHRPPDSFSSGFVRRESENGL